VCARACVCVRARAFLPVSTLVSGKCRFIKYGIDYTYTTGLYVGLLICVFAA